MRALLACLVVALVGCGPKPIAASSVATVTICPPGSSPRPDGSCGPAGPGKPRTSEVAEGPAAQKNLGAARGAGALQGRWHGEDSDAWGYYELSVSGGSFRQEITQIASLSTGPHTCVQEGELTLEEQKTVWHYVKNDCNAAYEGQTEDHEIEEMSGRVLILRSGTYTIHYERQR
jgi:hypothetical protein